MKAPRGAAKVERPGDPNNHRRGMMGRNQGQGKSGEREEDGTEEHYEIILSVEPRKEGSGRGSTSWFYPGCSVWSCPRNSQIHHADMSRRRLDRY